MSTPVPNYEPVSRPDLYDHDGHATFYRVTSVKGARVEGVIAVGMASHYGRDGWGKVEKETPYPQMWVELSPRIAGDDGKPADPVRREALRINGKNYDNRFYATVTFLRAEHDDDREQWYPSVTVDDRGYLLSDRVEFFPGYTEAARKALRPLLHKLAAEYVTAERWHDEQIAEAIRGVDRAKEKVAAKRAELEKAEAEVEAAWRDVDDVMKRLTEGSEAS